MNAPIPAASGEQREHEPSQGRRPSARAWVPRERERGEQTDAHGAHEEMGDGVAGASPSATTMATSAATSPRPARPAVTDPYEALAACRVKSPTGRSDPARFANKPRDEHDHAERRGGHGQPRQHEPRSRR